MPELSSVARKQGTSDAPDPAHAGAGLLLRQLEDGHAGAMAGDFLMGNGPGFVGDAGVGGDPDA